MAALPLTESVVLDAGRAVVVDAGGAGGARGGGGDNDAKPDHPFVGNESADDENSGLLGRDASKCEKVTPSHLRFIGLNAYMFSYGLCIATMGVIILPLESVRMFPDNHALFLGIMLGTTGVTQLVSPLAGYLSDRSTHKWGRRRPYMFGGAVLTMFGLAGMYIGRTVREPWSFNIMLGFGVLGLNITYAAFTALIPDFIPDNDTGTASGLMAVMGVTGACTGFCIFGFLLDPEWAYLVYAVVTCLTLAITCICAKETPLDPALKRDIIWSEIVASYSIDRSTHENFFWVFVVRAFYYMGVSVQAFILFFLRDVTRVDNPAYYTAIIAMLGQISAGLIAFPAGKLSDTIGRKILVRMACLIMASVYMLFLYLYKLKPVLILSFFYGFGNGIFIAVDYALAVDTLPDKENTARDLGIWGIAAFIGTTCGPLISGPLLYFVGEPYLLHEDQVNDDSGLGGEWGYHYKGYVWIMSLASFWLFMVIVFLVKVKGVD